MQRYLRPALLPYIVQNIELCMARRPIVDAVLALRKPIVPGP